MQLDSEPKRLSPLHTRHLSLNANLHLIEGWLVPEVYTSYLDETAAMQNRVGLVDISTQGKLTLKGVKADGIISAILGKSPISQGNAIWAESKHLLVARLTRDEFLILTPPGAEQGIANSLEAEIASQNSFVSVIDQTSGLVGLLISGPESIGLMRKLCALDFNPTDFPDLHVAQSSFAKVRTTTIRHDQNSLPTFELYADCSYGEYLWDTILDAGMEFGIQPVGWEAIRA
jgi:sarcosine oxidase subunit alpha